MSATATQLLFSAKFPFGSPPPVKRPSQREREYLHPKEVESLVPCSSSSWAAWN